MGGAKRWDPAAFRPGGGRDSPSAAARGPEAGGGGAGGAARAAPVRGVWTCAACTCTNDAANHKCHTCETPNSSRGSAGRPGSPGAGKSHYASSSSSAAQQHHASVLKAGLNLKPAEAPWKCPMCTTMCPARELKCISCEQSRY